MGWTVILMLDNLDASVERKFLDRVDQLFKRHDGFFLHDFSDPFARQNAGEVVIKFIGSDLEELHQALPKHITS